MRVVFPATFFLVFVAFTFLSTSHAATVRQKTCESTDAEEGLNVFKSGVSFVSLGGEVLEEKRDVCEDDKMLIEYFCNPENHTIAEKRVPCRQGCSDAKCNRLSYEASSDDTSAADETSAKSTSPSADNPESGADEETDGEKGKVSGFFNRVWQWIRLPFEKLQGFVGSLF